MQLNGLFPRQPSLHSFTLQFPQRAGGPLDQREEAKELCIGCRFIVGGKCGHDRECGALDVLFLATGPRDGFLPAERRLV